MFRSRGESRRDNRVYDANSGNISHPTVEQIFAIRRSIIYLPRGDMKEKVYRGALAERFVNNEVRIGANLGWQGERGRLGGWVAR